MGHQRLSFTFLDLPGDLLPEILVHIIESVFLEGAQAEDHTIHILVFSSEFVPGRDLVLGRLYYISMVIWCFVGGLFISLYIFRIQHTYQWVVF